MKIADFHGADRARTDRIFDGADTLPVPRIPKNQFPNPLRGNNPPPILSPTHPTTYT